MIDLNLENNINYCIAQIRRVNPTRDKERIKLIKDSLAEAQIQYEQLLQNAQETSCNIYNNIGHHLFIPAEANRTPIQILNSLNQESYSIKSRIKAIKDLKQVIEADFINHFETQYYK